MDITPEGLLPLEGYGARGGPATGTLDSLEAGALVLDDGQLRAALLCADLCGLEAPSVARVRRAVEEAGLLPADHLLVTYSHTHGAPAVTPFAGAPVDGTYLTWLEGRLALAVAEATRALRPVTVGVGEGSARLNVNRRKRTAEGMVMRANPQGLVDRRVRVLRLDPLPAAGAQPDPGTLGGHVLPQTNPLALLFSYPCHPTVLGASNRRYSADYPGAARRFVEQAYGAEAPATGESQTRALFLPPCFGNLRPHLLRPGAAGAEGAFREGNDYELTVLGRLLGSEVVRVAEEIPEGEAVGEIGVGRREVWLPYSRVPDEATLREALDGPHGAWARATLDRLRRDGRLPEGEMAEVQVIRLGRHWLLATPGETTLEIGLSIERGMAEWGLARPERGDLTLAVGYANGYVGYLCAASLIGEGGYEPGDYPSYGRPAPFAPEIEPALVNTVLSLAHDLVSKS